MRAIQNNKKSISLILVIFCLGIYIALALFSEYWLGVITNHSLGGDFNIYHDAFSKAVEEKNPYLPYQIGSSFVYHPFMLSFLSLFSWQGELSATIYWTISSTMAWVFATWLAFSFTQKALGKHVSESNRKSFGWVLAIFLGFAPFLETIHIGQINVFVILALCLMFSFSENEKPFLAGFFLATAIVFKTSPVIFIFYYLTQRKFRILLSCAISLLIMSLIPMGQFSSNVLWDFLIILPKLGGEIHPTSYNQSILSLFFRVSQRFGFIEVDSLLIISHKILLGFFLGIIFLSSLVRPSTKFTRLWEFALLLTLMTIFSPLVWYHHSIFLIIPSLLLLLSPRRLYAVSGAGLLFIIQFERLFEYKIVDFALPITLAHFILLGLGIWIYLSDYIQEGHYQNILKQLKKLISL